MKFYKANSNDEPVSCIFSDIMDTDVLQYTQIAHFDAGEEILKEDAEALRKLIRE